MSTIANPNPELRTYTDEALLAAVAHHAKGRGLTMDLAYRTTCNAPAELLIGEAQFKILVTELERHHVCGAGDLFETGMEEGIRASRENLKEWEDEDMHRAVPTALRGDE